MPGLDGTGPWGEGPMTGGGRGFCNFVGAGYRRPYGWSYGLGRGYGRGFGFRRGFAPWHGPYRWYEPAYGETYPMEPKQEINMLKGEADAMKKELNEINRRIQELEKESSG
jgi:hypothetical protein